MAIYFHCVNPSCGRSVRAPDSAGGKPSRCPFCRTVQNVPPTSRVEDMVPMSETPPAGSPAIHAVLPAQAARKVQPTEHQRSTFHRKLIIGAIIVVALVIVGGAVLMFWPDEKKDRREGSSGGGTTQPSGVALTPTNTPTASGNPIASYLGTLSASMNMAKMAASMETLKAVGNGIVLYGGMNEDKRPASLGDMVKANVITAEILVSPGDRSRKIVYILDQTASSPGENIQAYDPVVYVGSKVPVLRLNGAVETLSPDELKAQLKRQNAREQEGP